MAGPFFDTVDITQGIRLDTANTSLTNPGGGTVVSGPTGSSSVNRTIVRGATLKALEAITAEGMVYFWLYDSSGSTYRLIGWKQLKKSVAPDGTTPGWSGTWVPDMPGGEIKPTATQTIKCTITVSKAVDVTFDAVTQ